MDKIPLNRFFLNCSTEKLINPPSIVYDPVPINAGEETVKPISTGAESELLYKRWVDNRVRK
jgi:hypothetical protein